MNDLLFAQQGNHGLGSIIWRNVITKLCLHLVVALEHSLATIASWKDKAEMMGYDLFFITISFKKNLFCR